MAMLTIRRLSDDVHEALRVQAEREGRSMEAQARWILGQALASSEPEVVRVDQPLPGPAPAASAASAASAERRSVGSAV